MATVYSDQMTTVNTAPKHVKTNEWQGRVRQMYWTYTVPAGNQAINDLIELVKLPIHARILGGRIAFSAMTTGGAAASVQIGTAADATRYLETTSVDAVGGADFADTIARNYGEELTVETTVIAKVVTEAWAAAGVFKGHILYAVD
jgi:hypothetical protein